MSKSLLENDIHKAELQELPKKVVLSVMSGPNAFDCLLPLGHTYWKGYGQPLAVRSDQ